MSRASIGQDRPSVVANAVRILIVVAVVVGLVLNSIAAQSGFDLLVYFTIQSNIILGVYHAWALVKQNSVDTRRPTIARGAVSLYILITGSVYHFVLAPGAGFSMGEGNDLIGHLANLLLHTATPVLAAIDWLSFGRARKDVPWKAALYWLVYPLAYMIFAFVRGAFTHTFPYFFLDLEKYSVGEVALFCTGLGVGFYVLGLLVIAIGKGMSRVTAR